MMLLTYCQFIGQEIGVMEKLLCAYLQDFVVFLSLCVQTLTDCSIKKLIWVYTICFDILFIDENNVAQGNREEKMRNKEWQNKI